MPLTAASPEYLHVLQNVSLILLAAFFTPLCTFIAVCAWITSPFTSIAKHIKHHREWRQKSSPTFRPRTILVTGVGMSKGLTLARAFYRAGHRVIGADFEPYYVPVSGHFSKSIEKFFRLEKPSQKTGSAGYIQDLVSVIKKEGVELWVSCSGVASAVEDGEAAELVEKETGCKAVQYGPTLTETLHEKHSFIEHTKKLGLNVPTTRLVTSETEALSALYPSARSSPRLEKPQFIAAEKYIMKPVGMDDTLRADMTLLPLPTIKETEAHVRRMNPTPFRPFVLQQFISGPEYCTHTLVINGEIKCFVACPSSDLLMHYIALPTNSALSQAMYAYTVEYTQKTTPKMTGHFSLDFLVPGPIARNAEQTFGASDEEIQGLMKHLYPIECNPRAHTAVVLFSDESEDLADAYVEYLPDHEPKGISTTHSDPHELIVPAPSIPGYYWINHDIVSLLLFPILRLLRGEIGITEVVERWTTFVEHVLFWRDGNFVVWDPWPWWWSIVGYWPAMFLVCLWERRWWSRCNVSTGKLFEC
ncbi:Glutathione synthetase ATP-binding protein [Glarea lozoyensis ATCC 20868]|uniref:Glutathione synthetase ATP-binding protein n=1 Tax=Glarea lozoyensis (strain ATCC 20868 / MF5171) TaxID=1116229 RepID=S3CX26_GLAL2|nr:Glutathione synthetase ATP-binding protein [Glarea lozoyensis ATCC 20868]EPE24366.1 Glutathione synthetase ATP-binding protein [Glarea lozoyensis ATCC 20868]